MPEIYKKDKAEGLSHKPKTESIAAAIPDNSHNPLSAYCYYPKNIKFIAADDEERIILLLRRHWLTNLKWMATGLILLVVPLPFAFFPALLGFMPEEFLVISILFWYLVTMAYVLEKFLSWFFNVYIITDERVFDVDFYNLVDRDISDANIADIQDVTSAIRGAIRTAFDYGDVLIQTSAEIPQIDFEAVPHPDQVAKILRDLRVEEEREELEGRVR